MIQIVTKSNINKNYPQIIINLYLIYNPNNCKFMLLWNIGFQCFRFCSSHSWHLAPDACHPTPDTMLFE